MQTNVGIQHQGLVAWTGAAAIARDISNHIRFGFVFEAFDNITTEAVFGVEAAPPSAADPCVPGAFVPVEAVAICEAPLAPGALAEFKIPAGTLGSAQVPTVCAGTIPCRSGSFIRLVAKSGDTAKVRAVMILDGPH